MSLWDTPEFNKQQEGGGKFMKLMDFPTDNPLLLVLKERIEKVMTDELRAKLEAKGSKDIPEKFWVYYFTDLTTNKEREYSAFKPATALTIAMRNAKIEAGDAFAVLRIGEGPSTRFNITKLGKDVAVNEAMIAKAKEDLTKEPDTAGIPF